jgi:hypothetical protein
MANQLETVTTQQVHDVVFVSGEKIVQTDNLIALVEQMIAEMAPDKSSSTGDEYALAH